MTVYWNDLAARARSLSTRLFGHAQLCALAESPDLGALASALEASGLVVPRGGEEVSAAELEVAVRRRAASLLGVLDHRAGARAQALEMLFGDEDRRSIRALMRGAIQGAAAEARLSGLVPTSALPERALRELAGLTSPGEVALLLRLWRHPFAAELAAEARRPQPDLFRLELQLNRSFALAAHAGARGAGSAVADYLAELVDLENAMTLLVLSERGQDVRPEDCFLPGGHLLTLRAFVTTARTADRAETARALDWAFRSTVFRDVFTRYQHDLPRLEEELLRQRGLEQRRAALHDPMGPAPIFAFALALRTETFDLRRIIWGIALDEPRPQLTAGLLAAGGKR